MRTAGTLLIAVVALAAPAGAAQAAPVFGSTESFAGVTTGDWAPGMATSLSNPGTGGKDGVGDGYLHLDQSTTFRYGARNDGPTYAGDWTSAGITHVSLWLNDVGVDDTFEIHLCFGNPGNFWIYNIGFTPPEGVWDRFIVDLTNPADFTQIIGSGTFADALLTADRLLIRHDYAPFQQLPDFTSGDLGVDEIVLGDLAVPTRETSWGRLKSLYR